MNSSAYSSSSTYSSFLVYMCVDMCARMRAFGSQCIKEGKKGRNEQRKEGKERERKEKEEKMEERKKESG